MPSTGDRWAFTVPDATFPLIPLAGLSAGVGQSIATRLTAMSVPVSVTGTTQRDAWFPSPQAGDRVWRKDILAEEYHNGTTWKMWNSAWINYTPSATSFVVGAGSALNRYKFVAGRCLVHARYAIGSGGNITGNAMVAMPFTAVTPFHAYQPYGTELGNAFDLSLTTNHTYRIIANVSSATQVLLGYGAPSISSFITNAVPFAINSGDVYEFMWWMDPA